MIALYDLEVIINNPIWHWFLGLISIVSIVTSITRVNLCTLYEPFLFWWEMRDGVERVRKFEASGGEVGKRDWCKLFQTYDFILLYLLSEAGRISLCFDTDHICLGYWTFYP